MAKDLMTDKKDVSDEEIDRLIDELDNTDMEETDKMVMKELLRSNEKDIFFKTELTDMQINAIAKLLAINNIVEAQSVWTKDEKKGNKMMGSIVTDMTNIVMKLLVSKQRKGRMEFIDAWKGRSLMEGQQDRGMISKFLGRGE